MALRICVAGATGWTGRELVKAIARSEDLELAGAVARAAAGQDAGIAVGIAPLGVAISASLEAALDAAQDSCQGVGGTDVVIDYTRPEAVKPHALAAIRRGIALVIGTSGLGAADYLEIDRAARAAGVGVVAAGNFSLTATLMQRFALMAAALIGDVEVIDYAGAAKPDTPSGTARELAERLGEARCHPGSAVPLDQLRGPVETRGAIIGGVQVHSVRLPGHVLSCEAQFGMPGERLTIRHDAGESADPYVAGTLLAARRVRDAIGLRRGLDSVMG